MRPPTTLYICDFPAVRSIVCQFLRDEAQLCQKILPMNDEAERVLKKGPFSRV